MATMGVVESATIGEGYRSKKQVVLLNVKIDDPMDLQQVEYLMAGGECFIPVAGDTVLIHVVSEEYKVATATNTGVVESTLSTGEKALFAIADGEIKSSLKLLVNGEIVLNNGDDYAVKYSEMETAFNELKSDFNDLVSAYNEHIHVTTATVGASPTVGTISPTPSAGSSSTADIAPSKVEKVRV